MIRKTNHTMKQRILKRMSAMDEVSFCKDILLPLLDKMGYSDIKFTGGSSEYGKDIVFRKGSEYVAILAKKGDIHKVSSKSRGNISEILRQINEAFQIPYLTPNNNVKIKSLWVVASGKFKTSATSYLNLSGNNFPYRDSVIFVDGNDILEWIKKYDPNLLNISIFTFQPIAELPFREYSQTEIHYLKKLRSIWNDPKLSSADKLKSSYYQNSLLRARSLDDGVINLFLNTLALSQERFVKYFSNGNSRTLLGRTIINISQSQVKEDYISPFAVEPSHPPDRINLKIYDRDRKMLKFELIRDQETLKLIRIKIPPINKGETFTYVASFDWPYPKSIEPRLRWYDVGIERFTVSLSIRVNLPRVFNPSNAEIRRDSKYDYPREDIVSKVKPIRSKRHIALLWNKRICDFGCRYKIYFLSKR